MNPIQMFKLLSDYNKAKSIAKENVSMNTKITQYLVLAGTVAGLFSAWATGWLNGHAGAFTILVGIANVLAHLFPSIFASPSAASEQKAGLAGAKLPVMLLAVLAAAATMRAQTAPAPTVSQSISNLYLGGVSYNPAASQPLAGTAIYAHQANAVGTYPFTLVDVLPGANKTVTTNIGVGVAQKVATIAGYDIFVPTSAGISINGASTGWAWTGGALVPVRVKGNWYAAPNVRFLKSSVSGGSGYQLIAGVTFGWAK
jgi:hypothetical protein